MQTIRATARILALSMAILGAGLVAEAHLALPQSAKLNAFEASPDVYKLIAQDDHFRVILANWKPGQSDEWHTHHGDLVNYTLTDCKLQGQVPDGRSGLLERERGAAGFNAKGSIHMVRNVGTSDCQLLIIERK